MNQYETTGIFEMKTVVAGAFNQIAVEEQTLVSWASGDPHRDLIRYVVRGTAMAMDQKTGKQAKWQIANLSEQGLGVRGPASGFAPGMMLFVELFDASVGLVVTVRCEIVRRMGAADGTEVVGLRIVNFTDIAKNRILNTLAGRLAA